ncbi:Spy/CpxP family protein refolding chaperone [Acidovorax carolinensis]|nr:Spy/CpxP family protein refolding chaperone [Acidovorax carolinensis]
MAQRIDALKAQLKLTPAQEPAWTAFTAAMQPSERPARLDRTMDRNEMDKLTTPERIDRMRALRAQYAAEADRRGEATKTFYAALTPEQQKTFDAQAQPMRGKGGHRGDWGHGHGEHGHHGGMRGGDMPMGGMGGPAR